MECRLLRCKRPKYPPSSRQSFSTSSGICRYRSKSTLVTQLTGLGGVNSRRNFTLRRFLTSHHPMAYRLFPALTAFTSSYPRYSIPSPIRVSSHTIGQAPACIGHNQFYQRRAGTHTTPPLTSYTFAYSQHYTSSSCTRASSHIIGRAFACIRHS